MLKQIIDNDYCKTESNINFIIQDFVQQLLTSLGHGHVHSLLTESSCGCSHTDSWTAHEQNNICIKYCEILQNNTGNHHRHLFAGHSTYQEEGILI